MKITSRMLPFEVVREVKDTIRAQVALDRQDLHYLFSSSQGSSHINRLSAILEYGAADRELINQAIAEGTILQGQCYKNCHYCCNMSTRYDVEAFDVLLSYNFNLEAVKAAYRAGQLLADKEWCGMLEDGLCTINYYKPYTCLLTSPSPKGAEKGGCCFKGDKNAKTSVHMPTMVVTGRMRMLFKDYLPQLPEFVGRNINQAFNWAVHHMEVAAKI
jgi:hypothetical protein